MQLTRGNNSSPHTATLEGSEGHHSQSAVLHALMVGPHQERRCRQAPEPYMVRPRLWQLTAAYHWRGVQTPGCDPLNLVSCLVCEIEE